MKKEESLISLICVDQMNSCEIEVFIDKQNYENFEIVRMEEGDQLIDLIPYFQTTKSKYIIFMEKNNLYHKYKLKEALEHIELMKTEIVITPRYFSEDNKTTIACPTRFYEETFLNRVFEGKQFIKHCIENRKNLYGNLSCLMVKTEYIKKINWEIPFSKEQRLNKLYFLMNILTQGNLSVTRNIYVSTSLRKEIELDRNECYYYNKWINAILGIECNQKDYTEKLKKEITFFAMGRVEYLNLLPIAIEAKKRGYIVNFTENKQEKAEIGIYCQHRCYPENSKFSMILLHDMTQGHNRWPNIWESENWNNFDVGILPGYDWGERWSRSAFMNYSNPKKGVYILGYPKSDNLHSEEIEVKVKELREKWNFKYEKTILYAPSWEYDEKEEDFVKALATLPVNLLIKQGPWNQAYSHIIENIREMRRKHEGKYSNLYYIEPEEDINIALKLCDLVVSDESSVMTEALLYRKPSIAVIDWMIPDTTPARKASVPIDYVMKCRRVELREYVENFLSGKKQISVENLADYIFANRGNCCSDIMDCIDYYTQGKETNNFLEKKVNSLYGADELYI